MLTPEAEDAVIVLLKLLEAAVPVFPPLAEEEPLGIGRLNNKKSANCKVSNTRYHDDPSTLLRNMVIFNNTRKLYKFLSFNVIFAIACCCCTGKSVNETAPVLNPPRDNVVPIPVALAFLANTGVAEEFEPNPEDKRGIMGIEFLQRLVKKASRGVTRFKTPHTLVKF